MAVVLRSVAVALAALCAAMLVSFVAASWLRESVTEADLLWRTAPTSKVAIWTLAAGHGVPLELEAGAGVTSEPLQRIGRFFGRELEVGGSVSLLLAPLTVLVVAGFVLVGGARRIGAGDPREAWLAATAVAIVYGGGLSVLSALSATGVGFERRFVEAGVGAGVSWGIALFAGAVWSGVFTLAGALSVEEVRAGLPPAWRALGAGWWRAAAAASVVTACVLAVWLLVRGTAGEGPLPRPGLVALGAVMLWPNALAAALVVAHGAPMVITLTAGPLAGWRRLDYLHGAPDAGAEALVAWLFLLVPVVAGVVAGRAMARMDGGNVSISRAAGFGLAWGATLTVLAVLVRVRLLSSFSIRAFEAGGEAMIDPFAALLAGLAWGTVTAYAGMLSLRLRA